MITRETLKLFGCHADAVERFAKEAGLKVEKSKSSVGFKKGDWVKVAATADGTDRSIAGWIGQIVREDGAGHFVDFHGRPVPHIMESSRTTTSEKEHYLIWTRNLEKA